VQLTAKVREHALPHDLSTLVLADDRWFEYLMGASADAALITGIDFVPQGPERVRRLAASTQTGIVAFSAQMESEDFDVVSSTPISAIGRAYARLRARHDRVQLLAPDLPQRPGGTLPIRAPALSSPPHASTATTPRSGWCISSPRAATTPSSPGSSGSAARTAPRRSSASPATRPSPCRWSPSGP